MDLQSLLRVAARSFAMLLISLMSGCAALGPFSPLAPVERSIIFQPQRYPEGQWQPAGLNFEDAWFESEDGAQLHGWFVGHPQPRAVALFMHGNAGNITSRGDTLRILNERHGLAVMTFDYRGYGRSAGKPSEKGVLQDARAARRWLAERTGIQETDIVLMGRSLGGAVAIDLAASDSARGLVLASTFTSLPNVAAHHYGWLLPRIHMTQRLNSLAKISNYHGPLLISHGESDKLIPFEQGRQLYDAAVGPKRFITIPAGGHNSPQTEEYRLAFDEFIASLPAASLDRLPARTPQIKVDSSSNLRDLSPDGRRALEVAKAHLEQELLRDAEAVVSVSETGGEFGVYLEWIGRRKDGSPAFYPRGHALVKVSRDFQVVKVIPGA